MELSIQEERRQHPRAIAHWPVTLETTQGVVTGVTMDISAGGAFLCCRKPLKVTEKSLMVLHNVPLLDHSFSVEVVVTRSDIICMDDEMMAYGAGVRFLRIAAADRDFISILVSDHLEPKDINVGKVKGDRSII
jgi:hypothetical protein